MNERRTIIAVVLAGVVAALFTFLGPAIMEPEGLPADRSARAAPAKASKSAPAKASAERRAAPAKVRAAPAPAPGQRLAETRHRLVTKQIDAQLTSRGAALRSLRLRDPQFRRGQGDRARPIDLVSTDREKWLPMRIAFREGGADYPRRDADVDYVVDEATDRSILFRWTGEDLEVRKRFSLGGPYELWLTTTVTNKSKRSAAHRIEVSTWHWVRNHDEKSGMFRQSPWVGGGVCNVAGEVEHYDRGDIWNETSKAGRVLFTGLENIYFLVAMGPSGERQADCRLDAASKPSSANPQGTLYRATLGYPTRRLAASADTTYRTRLYFGPKQREPLEHANMGLADGIDYSTPLLPDVIAFPLCRGLLWTLKQFHHLVGNWGVAIILLTLVVKLLLFPLTAKSFRSMREMQRIKPLMDEVNLKYANDKDRKNQAMMELYKSHKINPFGGCLPILFQTPIWIALYTMLWRGVELYRAPFAFWYVDLSSADPYFVLPLLLGVTMFVQQKITPSTLDEAQQRMMLYFMPIMFTVFMLFLPAGLCLYSLSNSLLTIGQQRLLYRGQPVPAPVAPRAAATSEGKPQRRAGRDKR